MTWRLVRHMGRVEWVMCQVPVSQGAVGGAMSRGGWVVAVMVGGRRVMVGAMPGRGGVNGLAVVG